MKTEKVNKFLRFLKVLKKRLKLRNLLFLSLLFVANSYAWFIYATKVNNAVEAHVRAWNVRFDYNETELSEYIDFNIDDMYPGMEEYSNSIKIVNSGEAIGKIEYEIIGARIIDKTFAMGTEITSEQLKEKLISDYPFKIEITTTNQNISPNGGEESFVVKVNWPYESGDDEKDTYWGNEAYKYHLQYPTETMITLNIKVTVVQT